MPGKLLKWACEPDSVAPARVRPDRLDAGSWAAAVAVYLLTALI